MKRKRKKDRQPIVDNESSAESKSDSISDYLYELSNSVCEEEVSRGEFDTQLSLWKEKWRQRPLEYWQKYYKLPSEIKNDGNRDKPS